MTNETAKESAEVLRAYHNDTLRKYVDGYQMVVNEDPHQPLPSDTSFNRDLKLKLYTILFMWRGNKRLSNTGYWFRLKRIFSGKV